MKKYEHQRGAILVESALVVGAIFLMLFGTVFLSIIGFDQMSADGASYEVAHQTSVGASAPPAVAAHNTFPNIPTSNITTTLQPAPNSSIAVDYGYNDSDTVTAANADNNRHGGVSVMQGTSVSGSANKSSAAILGMPIHVLGSMVEPMWLENGLHFDAQSSNNYGSTTQVCSTPPPYTPPATPQPARCFQGNVFSDGENAPQYYTSVNVLVECAENLPWGTGLPGVAAHTPDVCSANSEAYTPLGVAEFLDITNWCPTTGAAAQCTTSPATAGISGSKQADSTFANIACHQRVYQKIANFFVGHQNLHALLTAQGGTLPTQYNSYSPSTNPYGPPFYYFALEDQTNLSSSGNGQSSFKYFAGYDSSRAGEPIADGTQPTDGAVDNAIREVYNWDGTALANPPVADPLNPNVGC